MLQAMSFSNLFSKLSAMDEDVRSCGRSGFTVRNQTENHGTKGTKRKTQGEQHGSHLKKRCYQSQNTTASGVFRDDNSSAKCHQKRSDDSPAGQAKGTRTNHKCKPDYNKQQSCCSQNYKQNCNVKKKKKKPKKKTEKYEQHYRNRRYENRDGRQDLRNQDKPKFMTQEFKDQNALLVDGQLEDSCQLLHIQGYNDLIKEACKFYIQGFCLKGERCIFMHKSFPCKFFHRRRKCLQEENCRFSHDPLNDLTEKLLDEQEKMYDVTKEEETETNKNPDLLTETLRPNFYNSTETEKETNPSQVDVSVSDSANPQGSPSSNPIHSEPVCYSVEAVLGPQLSKTFSSFSKTLGSQESDETVSFSHQSEVPYSVDAVLKSCKSVENSNFGSYSSTLYNPRIVSETVGDPQKKTLSEKATGRENSHQENRFISFLSSRTNTDTASDIHRRSEGSNIQAVRITSQEDELQLCPPVSEAEKSATSRTEESLNLLTGMPSSESTKHPCLSKHPNHCNLSFLVKPSSPPSDISEFKARVAAPVEPLTTSGNISVAANVGVHRFAAKQLADIFHNSKKKQPVIKPAASEIAQNSWSKTLKSVGPLVTPSAGSKEFIKPKQSADGKGNSSSFLSLFAMPLGSSDLSFQSHASHSATPSCSNLSANKPQSNPEPKHSGLDSISSGLRTESPVTSQSLQNDNAAVKQVVIPVSDRSDSSGEQRLHEVSSPRGTESNSVLKALFLHLKPYKEDKEPQDCKQSFIHSDGEKEKRSSTEEQQLKNRKEKDDLRTKKTTLLPDDFCPPSPSCTQAPEMSKVAYPGKTEPQAIHSFPFKSETCLGCLGAKPASKEEAELNRNTVTPLRDLFKTLDTTVFHKL